MDRLFGIPLTSILVALLALLAGTFAVLGWIAWRHPLLVRLGLRNVVRRRAQTVLIVVGLMLSTLIISAAFATGDTVGFSVTNAVYDDLGEVDFIVGVQGRAGAGGGLSAAFVDEMRTALAEGEAVDGLTAIVAGVLPAVSQGPDGQRLSEPTAQFTGIDPTTVAGFGGLRTPSGEEVSADLLGGNRAFVTEDLADEIDVGAGDRVTVFYKNQPHDFEVVAVVRDNSITTPMGVITSAAPGPQSLSAGGLVVSRGTASALLGRDGEVSFVAVSVAGGTRDTGEASERARDAVEGFLEAQPGERAEIVLAKQQLLFFAELFGSVFVTFFLIFGLFSIAAGIMLIFLIFIMLAAERRSEMGMARAIGMNRLHLTESFLAEGMAYNLGSAAVGALLGLGVAALLVFVLGRLVGDFGLAIRFHFNPQAFLIAYSMGVVLTFATVAFSSYRAAHLNIVRAIRDLPEPQPLRGANRSAGGLLQATLGALWTVAWVALLGLGGVLLVPLFLAGLAFYGVPYLAIGLLVAWFVFGVRAAARPFAATRGRVRRALYLGWWLLFTVTALIAPASWLLLRSRAWATRHRNVGGWAVLLLALGLLLVYTSGWESSAFIPAVGEWMQGKAFAYAGGFTLSVFALAMLAVYFGASSRLAFTAAGVGLVWYWLLPLPFSLFTEVRGVSSLDPVHGFFRILGLPRPLRAEGNIEMFFVSGIAITAASTLVVIFNADRLLAVVSLFGRALGGITPAVKTAVAYPLAAKFRTAMTLAMFTLVVFSLVVMATLNHNFTQLFLGDAASAGFDVLVEANASNQLGDLRAALADAGYEVGAEIAGVGTLLATSAEMRSGGEGEFARYVLQGVDDEFLALAQLPLQGRAEGYATDAAVIEALRSDPTVAVVDATRLQQPAGPFGEPPGQSTFRLPLSATDLEAGPWAPIPLTVRNPESGAERELRVIGVLEPQVSSLLPPLSAVFTARENVEVGFEGDTTETFLLTAGRGRSEAAGIALARDIESALLERGVQASSIKASIEESAALSTAFQSLFQGFMGLGLIVGIAALGVIAFRTVVERRQQIGVLRAIGYSRRLIGLSFFFESSFIALAGIAAGLLLGVALSYNLLTSGEIAPGGAIDFQTPWLRLLVIAGIAYGASALMTLVPARTAARTVVAEALRYE